MRNYNLIQFYFYYWTKAIKFVLQSISLGPENNSILVYGHFQLFASSTKKKYWLSVLKQFQLKWKFDRNKKVTLIVFYDFNAFSVQKCAVKFKTK